MYGSWGRRGLLAFTAGLVAGVPFAVLPSLAGFSFTGWSPASGERCGLRLAGRHAGGGLGLLTMTRSLDRAGEQAAFDSEQELQANDDNSAKGCSDGNGVPANT